MLRNFDRETSDFVTVDANPTIWILFRKMAGIKR
jgi:hypothetical protein